MADINELTGKVLNTLGTVVGKTRTIAGKAADKAKDMARIAKLNVEVGSEKNNIEKAYLEIGKLYYETHKSAPDSFFVQLCDEITLANENIDKLQSEIDCIKNGCDCGDDCIQVEFEEIPVEKPVAEQEDFVKEDNCTCGCQQHSHPAE